MRYVLLSVVYLRYMIIIRLLLKLKQTAQLVCNQNIICVAALTTTVIKA